jgi:hypothetical protein
MNLTDELTRLFNQLTEAGRMVWESDERKRIQAEITDGIRNFGGQVDEAVRKASESETAKKVKTQAEQAADKARESDVVDDMRQGLLVGLQALNRELGRLLERLQTTPAPVTTGPVPPVAPAPPSDTNTTPAAGEPPSDQSAGI